MKDVSGGADAGGLREQFDRLRTGYPSQMSASLVLPLLQIVQEQKGHVTPADAHFVADYAGVPRAQAVEALSWYTMLHRQPVGRHVVKVCRNIACALRGSDRLLAHVEKKLGCKAGQSTADGKFYIKVEEECLAACCGAPMMMVDHVYYENLTPKTVDQILDAVKE